VQTDELPGHDRAQGPGPCLVNEIEFLEIPATPLSWALEPLDRKLCVPAFRRVCLYRRCCFSPGKEVRQCLRSATLWKLWPHSRIVCPRAGGRRMVHVHRPRWVAKKSCCEKL